MGKRDTYRDEPDWAKVEQAMREERELHETEQLMQPDTYERTRRCNGRRRHY